MNIEADAPSLALVRAGIDLQLAEHERRASEVDSRAGLIIGFGGVLIGLGQDIHNFLQGVAMIVAGLASIAGAVALWPRVTAAFHARDLRDEYLSVDPATTALVLLDTRIGLFQRDERRLDRKIAWVRFAVVGLGTSIALMLAGTIVEYLR